MTTPPATGDAAPALPDYSTGIHGLLDVEVVEATPERIVMRMPVDARVHQPYGILHGGVSALLAESAASFGGALNVGAGKGVVGIELNASHLRPLRDGHLTATATPVRIGRTVHVWRISLADDQGRGICEARCSLSVVDLSTVDSGAVTSAASPE